MPEKRITNTKRFPYRTAVSIHVKWSDGYSSRGSGVMVGKNDVLTAAHVVYNPAHGHVTSITVYAGRNGKKFPYGAVSWKQTNYYKINYSPVVG